MRLLLDISFNKYAFGVPLSQDFIFKEDSVKQLVDKYLIDNFDMSFEKASYSDLPDDFEDYCWIPWSEYNKDSLYKIQCRRDLYTPFTLTSRDIEFYDGEDELLSYRKTYFNYFPIKYILKMCKKHLGGFVDKKCLILGCGTGESVLMLESYGINTLGLESSRYAFDNCAKLAKPSIKFCDFLAELFIIESKKYDFVFTNLLNWIDRKDIPTILSEINRVSTMFMTQYISDGNSYKTKSKSWWQKQITKSGMIAFPASARVAMCS